MMTKTVESLENACNTEGLARPIVLAVTVLTSLDDDALAETGVDGGTTNQVVRLAKLAAECGIDGVVASPLEIEVVRGNVVREGFVVLTPGIRPAGSGKDDQKRVMTPGEALVAGSDYLVIGRPITGAASPVEAARAIASELATARGIGR